MLVQTYVRDMTITHAEFIRSLHPLKRHYCVSIDGDLQHIVITDLSGRDLSGCVQSGCDLSGRARSGCVQPGQERARHHEPGYEARQVHINLGLQSTRQLGSMHLPSTEVTLTFHGFADKELELFWSRFDLSFRRGGG